jgi:hypothetical protein
MVDHFPVGEPNLTISAWLRRRRDDGWISTGEPRAVMHEGRISIEYTFERVSRHLHVVRPDHPG